MRAEEPAPNIGDNLMKSTLERELAAIDADETLSDSRKADLKSEANTRDAIAFAAAEKERKAKERADAKKAPAVEKKDKR